MPRRTRLFSRLAGLSLVSRVRARLAQLAAGRLGHALRLPIEKLQRLGLLESTTLFVLTIGDEGATLVQLKGGEVIDAVFIGPETENGLETLRGYIQADGRARILVTADVLEQMYRDEQMPKVGRLDRANILKRRLDVAFPQDRLKAALPLSTGGKALFASLPETEAIAQWVEFLESLANPVVGFCLMPLESAGIAGRLGPSLDGEQRQVWRVLVSQQATSGFRQIFESDGRMMVTRLTQRPSTDLAPEAVAQLIERELRSSISYVKRLGYSDQDRLDLIVLDSPEVCRAVQERDLPISSLTAYTPHQAGLMLGLGDVAPEESGLADVLHARWLAAKRRPMLTLPSAAMRQRLLVDLIFKVGFALAGAMSLFAVYDLTSLVFDAFETTTTTDVLARQLTTEQQASELIRAKLNAYDVALEDVLLIDRTADDLARNAVDVNHLFEQAAGALQPGMVVQKAIFRVPSLSPEAGTTAAKPSGSKLLAKGSASDRKGESVYELQLLVRFAKTPGQPDMSLQQAKDLQIRLKQAFPDFDVDALQLPVSALNSKILEGKAGQADAAPAGPAFAEFLVRKRA